MSYKEFIEELPEDVRETITEHQAYQMYQQDQLIDQVNQVVAALENILHISGRPNP